MTCCEWIVCERSGHWAAALRRASDRSTAQPIAANRLLEVRSLSELTAGLHAHPSAVTLIEAKRNNLADILTWLIDANRSYPRSRSLVLLDGESFVGEIRAAVAGSLVAAGAAAIADSPRHVENVLAVGQRHAALQRNPAAGSGDDQTFAEWAWALLPWQSA